MTQENSLNKSSLILIAIAAGLIGLLLGFGASKNSGPEVVASTAENSSTNVAGALPFRNIKESEFENIKYDEYGKAAPYNIGENFSGSDKPFKQETLEIELALDQTVEYKAIMDQGDSIVYEWSVEDGELYTDFHAHPAGTGEFFTRYSETEGSSDQGAIVAAYGGQHGWFWLNISDEPVTVVLKVAGFFDEIIEVDLEAEGY